MSDDNPGPNLPLTCTISNVLDHKRDLLGKPKSFVAAIYFVEFSPFLAFTSMLATRTDRICLYVAAFLLKWKLLAMVRYSNSMKGGKRYVTMKHVLCNRLCYTVPGQPKKTLRSTSYLASVLLTQPCS